jgi:hypothetical protein
VHTSELGIPPCIQCHALRGLATEVRQRGGRAVQICDPGCKTEALERLDVSAVFRSVCRILCSSIYIYREKEIYRERNR